MIIVAEAVIDDAVASASFCCDLSVCKGACCCLEGGRGAPLEDSEVGEIERAYPVVKEYLPESSRQAIESNGLVDGSPGDYATMCVNNQECVFAFFEDGIARCAFERTYLEGRTTWRKPISCHLFPIRVTHFGRDFIRYDMIDECKGGRERGARDGVKLYDFLQSPLTRKYGGHWYQTFHARCTPDEPEQSSC